MNPYDFVRIDWTAPGELRPAPRQDRLEGISGRLHGTLKTLTPLLISGQKRDGLQLFQRDPHGRYVIPGASLKGLMRNLVETVGGGAWWFFGRDGQWRDREVQGDSVNYRAHLPEAFRRPTHLGQLDAACRLFGFLGQRQVLAGSVGFDDATCADPVSYDPIYTCILSSPKPRHHVWYLDDEQQLVRGRKFYFHAARVQTATGWLPRADVAPQQRQNAHIQPVGANSVFSFRAHFTNVAPDDFALLLYALVLEPGMRHKLGYAKPAGLGSVEISLDILETVDYRARYTSRNRGLTRYEGASLQNYIGQAIEPYTRNQTAVALQDLRRIWQWPPVHETRYPDRDWFTHNPTTSIDATP